MLARELASSGGVKDGLDQQSEVAVPPPSYAGEFPSGLRFQALHRFHGLRPEFERLGTPCSRPKTRPLTAPQASRHAMDRIVAPPTGAFDAGLRPGPFPGRAASLLPGLLAATRTGLPPAGDDELTNTKIHHGTTSRCHLPFCWTHESSRLGTSVGPRITGKAPNSDADLTQQQGPGSRRWWLRTARERDGHHAGGCRCARPWP